VTEAGQCNDHSRLACADLLASESPADCVAFLGRALSWYAESGITIELVLSDNGNGYRLARCLHRAQHPATLHTLAPPQTNGKAEALVKTLLREWAYRFA